MNIPWPTKDHMRRSLQRRVMLEAEEQRRRGAERMAAELKAQDEAKRQKHEDKA